MVSKSTIAIFVLVFAILGLLLGYAETTSHNTTKNDVSRENIGPTDENESVGTEEQYLKSG